MEYVLYLDVLFLTDFFFNLLSLFLTAVFLRKAVHALRFAVAAAVGSFWNCLLVLYPVMSAQAELLVTMFGIGSLMTTVAFGSNCARKPFWNVILEIAYTDIALFVASSVLGGCLRVVQERFWLNDWELLAFAGALTGAVGLFLQNVLLPIEIGKERFLVRLHYQGKWRDFTALADSGNRLRVPDTQKPVSLIGYQDCKDFCDRISGGFFIPYRAVGTDHGLLFAITFEKMEIKKNGMCITIENPAVAIVKEPLSSNGDFNMLLPEEYVTEISGCSNRRRKSQ